MAMLSMIALYNQNDTIFDTLQIPEGLDKEVLIENLLMELGEFETLYPNPAFMKFAVGAWSKKEILVWNKLYETTQYEYNAIQNFDKTEDFAETETRGSTSTNNETANNTGNNTETRNLTLTEQSTTESDNTALESRDLSVTKTNTSETGGTTQNNGTDMSKEYVSAFNETTPTLKGQTENVLGSGSTVESTEESSETAADTGTVTSTDSRVSESDKTENAIGTIGNVKSDNSVVERENSSSEEMSKSTSIRAFGNIGVTTTQMLIREERDVVKFSVYDYIIKSFKSRFCILIY